MLRFKQFVVELSLNEVFNKVYPWKWTVKKDNVWKTKFKDVDVFFNKENDFWELSFNRNGSQSVTGEGDQFAIFATIIDITKDFISTVKPHKFVFSAEKEDSKKGISGRAKLYSKLLKTFAAGAGYTYKEQSPYDDYIDYVLTRKTNKLDESSNVCPILTIEHMKAFEKFVDKMFEKFNIDFDFTKHFRERMTDSRNDPCIDMKELAAMIQKIYKKYQHGEKSLSKFVDAEAVVKDLQSDLNMPIAVEYDRKNDELIVIAKTIMRKKNFSTPNPVLKV